MKINTRKLIENIFNDFKDSRTAIKILEAGCGSASKLSYDSKCFITGIDVSEKQLSKNKIVQEKIVGDVQHHNFNQSEYDVVICWHVLEHLENPVLALNNFIYTVKPDGLIILAAPNPYSIKGLLTKYTPHWFHVFIYRNIYGNKYAGQDDRPPFKTFMRFSMSPRSILKLAKKNSLKIELFKTSDAFKNWVGRSYRKKSLILYYLIILLIKIGQLISFNNIGDSEFVMVIRKFII
jgi:2-polyprenyl-3-methyl-5-hydroxy-6-metoxy-1,4-benzoquinol methylase